MPICHNFKSIFGREDNKFVFPKNEGYFLRGENKFNSLRNHHRKYETKIQQSSFTLSSAFP